MWLERWLETLRVQSGPFVFTDGAAWGTSHLIAQLHEPQRPLVWLELTRREADDPVAQGNRLAEAVHRALGSTLFGRGLPYAYGLATIRHHLALLGPFTFDLEPVQQLQLGA